MTRLHTLVALLTAASFGGVARASDPPKAAAPNATKSSVPLKGVVKVALGSSFTVPNVAGVPGEKKTLTAILKEDSPGNPPLEGKTPSFQVSGNGIPVIDLKASQTDAQGKTTAALTIPDLAQGTYDIHVAWKGDAGHKPSTGSAKLTVIKAPTKVELSDLVWGTYKNEGGPPNGSFSTLVKRKHDNGLLTTKIKVTVNGVTSDTGTYSMHVTPLEANTATWVVHVQFEGNAAYAASSADRTYHKPKK